MSNRAGNAQQTNVSIIHVVPVSHYPVTTVHIKHPSSVHYARKRNPITIQVYLEEESSSITDFKQHQIKNRETKIYSLNETSS